MLGHLMARILQNKTVTSSNESVGSLVTSDTLIGKALEDLLKSSLANAILLDAQGTLFLLELSKEPADSFVFLGYTKLKEFSAVLKDLNIPEIFGEVAQDAKSVGLSLKELKQIE